MNVLLLISIIVGCVIVGTILGFFIAIIVQSSKKFHSSGILHIKETEEKDYFTIEITDDLLDVMDKKAIVLTIDRSR